MKFTLLTLFICFISAHSFGQKGFNAMVKDSKWVMTNGVDLKSIESDSVILLKLKTSNTISTRFNPPEISFNQSKRLKKYYKINQWTEHSLNSSGYYSHSGNSDRGFWDYDSKENILTLLVLEFDGVSDDIRNYETKMKLTFKVEIQSGKEMQLIRIYTN